MYFKVYSVAEKIWLVISLPLVAPGSAIPVMTDISVPKNHPVKVLTKRSSVSELI